MARDGKKSLAYMVVAIALGVANCVESVKSGSAAAIVVAIVMLAMLSVGLGYVYSRHEAEMTKAKAEGERAKSALKRVATEEAASEFESDEKEESADGE